MANKIVFSTKLDNKDLMKDLADTEKEIKKTEKTISAQEAKKSPLEDQAEALRAKMKAAREEVQRYRQEWAAGTTGADKNQSAAQTRLAGLRTEYQKVEEKINKIDEKLQPAYQKMDGLKEKAGGLHQRLAKTSGAMGKMKDATAAAEKKMDAFVKRVKGLAKRVFVFTLITAALRSLKDWLWKAIKTNDEAVSAIAKLKGALLTLAQPLVDVVIPAFTFLVNVLTRVVAALARVFAALSGSTVEASKESAKALKEQIDALDGVSSSADGAAGSLAGFDEINKLSSGSAAPSSSGIEADFDFGLGEEMTEFQEFLTLLGLGAVLVASLAKSFGKTGVAIGIFAIGLGLLVGGFKDAIENGWDLENMLTTIGGIMAAGIGISLLTGSWIPLLIAAIAGLLLAITVAFGEGENLIDGVKQMLSGFADFFGGIFTGDIERAVQGLGNIFGGLSQIVDSILTAIENMFNSFFDWLDEKTSGKFSFLIDNLRAMVSASIGLIRDLLGSSLDFLQGTLEGLIIFLSGVFTGDWDKAWDGILHILRSGVNFGGSLIEALANFFIRGANAIIRGLNRISFTMPDWVPGIGGRYIGFNIPSINEIKLPRLATGAVIPPNREFMAILGDQTSGNNIEAPEGLIRKIVREEAGGGDYTALLEAILAAIKAGKIMRVDKRTLGRIAAEGINDLTLSAGESILIL